MKKHKINETATAPAERRAAGAAGGARSRPRPAGGMVDASAATSALQRYQRLAGELPEAVQLQRQAQLMSASKSAASMRALQATVQKQGVAVNDDAGLEEKADAMGARAVAQGAALGSASGQRNGSATPERAPTAERPAGTTIQMAGHTEDLCFVGRWLVKRADSIEIAQYQQGEVPQTAPSFHGPYYTAQEALDFLHTMGEGVVGDKLAKIQLMAQTMRQGGKGFMMLENATAGMANPKMRDLKMGTHTVSGTDQERHDVTGIAKVVKVARHDVMDKFSGSSERGYRDEDRWQSSKKGDNTDQLQRMLDRASASALLMIYGDLDKFVQWLVETDVVYVGMSLLVVAGGDKGKAVAIDFEHPIRKADNSYDTHLEGLFTGAKNLMVLVDEFIRSFSEREQRRELARLVYAEKDRRRRRDFIASRQGNINDSGEGNFGIGNEEL